MQTEKISYERHRFPPQIIAHVVWLYARFNLSLLAANCMRSPNPARHQLRRKVWPKSRRSIASGVGKTWGFLCMLGVH